MRMINNISEGSVRLATKVDPVGAIHDKEVVQQKAQELREARPVEKTETDNQTNGKNSKKEESKYLVDNKKLVFEKYNKNGDVILRIPPSHKPVNQRV